MSMIYKFCTSCYREAWHNARKAVGSYRCCHCGHPISTNMARREREEFIRKRLSALPVKAGI